MSAVVSSILLVGYLISVVEGRSHLTAADIVAERAIATGSTTGPIIAETIGQFANMQILALPSGGVVGQQGSSWIYIFSQLELNLLAVLTVLIPVLLALSGALSLIRFSLFGSRAGYIRYLVGVGVVTALLVSSPLLYWPSAQVAQPWFEVLRLLAVILVLKTFSEPTLRTVSNKPFLVAYASQTGSAKKLAMALADANAGRCDLTCLSALSPEQLRSYQSVFFIVSTYGSGESPDTAARFLTKLLSIEKGETEKNETRYCVLALGDSTYPKFCAYGETLDRQLAQCGFERERPLQRVNRLDPHSISEWLESLSDSLDLVLPETAPAWQPATLLFRQQLNPGSPERREAYHLRLQVSDLEYQPGDLLAIQPGIASAQYAHKLANLGWTGAEAVKYHQQTMPLIEALSQLEWHDEFADTPQALIDLLSPVSPRLYSIASFHKDYIDILVRQHYRADHSPGLCSSYLASLQVGELVSARVQSQDHFRLMPEVPIIMIAAGTGLAPFMSFLSYRQQQQEHSAAWLFFGEQYAEHDHYFAQQLSDYQQAGVLTRLNLAWSRSEHQYITAKLIEQRAEVRRWVCEEGAHIYLCGSLSGFGESVQRELLNLFSREELADCLHCDLY